MTTDVTAGIGITIDSAGALAQLRQLQAGISQFNQSVISSNSAAVSKQQDLIKTFSQQVEGTRQFTTGLTEVESSVHRLGKSIDTGKLKLGDYFRYGVAASGKFKNAFGRQQAEIMNLATDRVKKLQTQYVSLGTAHNGMTKALAVRPLNLFNADAAIGTQRMQIFNKLMTDGSTSLVNWGKNTQWAGRQLMVGFSMPLAIFGAMAIKVFRDIEMASVSFRRVYGDAFTSAPETEKALNEVKALASEYTKYGIAVKDTIGLAAKAAALGSQGPDLIAQTKEATRLSTLGQIEYQQALDTTISLQTAFGISSADLGTNIDFLNAVENQTVLSIDDVTQAIPKVAPVIKALGGNVQDLTYMLTAMREGGVNAAQGSNALKSGLMSLINPTQAAIDKSKELGIDLEGIVSRNAGNLPGMIKEIGAAFASIDDGLKRQQLMGKVFGKYQVARMTAMFANINKEGGQASRVLDLMGSSMSTLASISDKELSKIEQAVSIKFAGSLERLKAEVAPIGEQFLTAILPVMDAVEGILKAFNGLNPQFRQFLVIGTAIGGIVLPTVTMLVGLFANMGGMIIKFLKNPIMFIVNGFKNAGASANYLATAELDTEAATASLEGRVTTLTGSLNVQASAVARLVAAYERMSIAASAALRSNPAGFRTTKIPGFAKGRIQIVPGMGSGKKDTELAMLAPGEAVINAEDSKRFAPLLALMNQGKLPGYAGGKTEGMHSVNVGGTNVEYKPWGKGAPEKMQAMVNDVVAEGSQYAQMLIRMFQKLEGSAVSVNNIADKLTLVGNPVLSDIGARNTSKSGWGAPNDFAKAKKEGLDADTGTKTFFNNQLKTTQDDLKLWAQKNGQTLPSGALNAANYGTHISHLTKGGEAEGKNWLPKRVGVDSGYINTYTEATQAGMKKMVNTLVEMDKGGKNFTLEEEKAAKTFMQIATSGKNADGSLNAFKLSAEQAKYELALLAQDMHPQTMGAVAAVRAIATTDLKFAKEQNFQGRTPLGTSATSAWKARAAQTAAQFSLDNNGPARIAKSTGYFSKTMGTVREGTKFRAMSGAEFAAADKEAANMSSRIKRWATKFSQGLVTSLQGANISLGGAEKALGIHSPAKEITLIGDSVQQGAILAVDALRKGKADLKLGLGEFGTSIALTSKTLTKSTVNAGDSVARAIKAAGIEINAAALTSASSGTPLARKKIGGGKLQGALGGLDMAFMAGSMFLPGQLAEFSQKLMFASMGVQAFTGMLQGMAAVSGAAKLGGIFAPIASAAPLAGTALGALASPAGIAVAALVALGGIAWLVYNHYKEEEKKLHAFGEAVKTTTETLQSAATSFGYNENVSSINTRTQDTDKGAQARAVTAQSWVRDQAKAEGENGDKFRAKLDVVKSGTAAQAEQVLRQTFTSLLASGAPGDVAKSIVEQMANEVNRQNIFKKIGDDLGTALDPKGKIRSVAQLIQKNMAPGFEAAATAAKKVADQEKLIEEAKKNGIKIKGGYDQKTLESIAKYKKNIEAIRSEEAQTKAGSGSIVQQSAEDLNKFLGAGLIDQQQFQEGFLAIKNSVQQAFPTDAAAQADAYTNAVQGMGVQLQYNLPVLNDAAVAAATLNAVMSGADPTDINNALLSAAGNAGVATAALNVLAAAAQNNPVVNGTANIGTIEAQIAAKKNQITSLTKKPAKKKAGSGGGGGGGGGSAPKSKYDKKSDAIAKANARLDIQEVKIDRTEDSKIQHAMDQRWGGKTVEINGLKVTVKNSADVEYAMQQIDETIEDINRNQVDPLNDRLDVLHDKQDKINRQITEWQQEIDKINEGYAAQTKPLERANTLLEGQQATLEATRDKQLQGIDLQTSALQNQIDVAQYAAEVQGKLLDDQMEKNSLNAELIDKQVQAIDDQISALEDVKTLNDILAAQKQSQLGLASALSSGDAGAAAAAMLESQSSAAGGASQLQTAGMTGQRDELQAQSDALNAQNDLLSKRKDAMDRGVDALNRQLAALTQQRTLIEDNYKLELQGIANSIANNSERIRQLTFERDTRVQFWQDQIDKYAPALRDLDNQIYDIEQKIKKIQDEKIKPLERQRDLLADILGDVQQQIAREKAVIDQKRKQLDYANKINNAMKTLFDRSKAAGGAAGGIGTALGSSSKALQKALADLKELEAKLKAAKFQKKIEMGMVTKDKNGAIKVFNSPGEAAQYVSETFGNAKVVTKNDIEGTSKINGKNVKGDYSTIARKISEALDNDVKKHIITQISVDPEHKQVKITAKKVKGEMVYTLNGKSFTAARGGILPGFRGVTHGDNVPAMLRSGEGVTVGEALSQNKYETKRLLALNKAALSGNMGSFYRDWSAPEITTAVPVMAPAVNGSTSGDTYNEYNLTVSGFGSTATADEIAGKVMYTIKEAQRGQIRSRS